MEEPSTVHGAAANWGQEQLSSEEGQPTTHLLRCGGASVVSRPCKAHGVMQALHLQRESGQARCKQLVIQVKPHHSSTIFHHLTCTHSSRESTGKPE